MPAVIIAVTNGNKILLSKYANREYTRYALLAGFTEIGESVEETVKREVMEEVGLHVKKPQILQKSTVVILRHAFNGLFCRSGRRRQHHA